MSARKLIFASNYLTSSSEDASLQPVERLVGDHVARVIHLVQNSPAGSVAATHVLHKAAHLLAEANFDATVAAVKARNAIFAAIKSLDPAEEAEGHYSDLHKSQAPQVDENCADARLEDAAVEEGAGRGETKRIEILAPDSRRSSAS